MRIYYEKLPRLRIFVKFKKVPFSQTLHIKRKTTQIPMLVVLRVKNTNFIWNITKNKC